MIFAARARRGVSSLTALLALLLAVLLLSAQVAPSDARSSAASKRRGRARGLRDAPSKPDAASSPPSDGDETTPQVAVGAEDAAAAVSTARSGTATAIADAGGGSTKQDANATATADSGADQTARSASGIATAASATATAQSGGESSRSATATAHLVITTSEDNTSAAESNADTDADSKSRAAEPGAGSHAPANGDDSHSSENRGGGSGTSSEKTFLGHGSSFSVANGKAHGIQTVANAISFTSPPTLEHSLQHQFSLKKRPPGFALPPDSSVHAQSTGSSTYDCAGDLGKTKLRISCTPNGPTLPSNPYFYETPILLKGPRHTFLSFKSKLHTSEETPLQTVYDSHGFNYAPPLRVEHSPILNPIPGRDIIPVFASTGSTPPLHVIPDPPNFYDSIVPPYPEVGHVVAPSAPPHPPTLFPTIANAQSLSSLPPPPSSDCMQAQIDQAGRPLNNGAVENPAVNNVADANRETPMEIQVPPVFLYIPPVNSDVPESTILASSEDIERPHGIGVVNSNAIGPGSINALQQDIANDYGPVNEYPFELIPDRFNDGGSGFVDEGLGGNVANANILGSDFGVGSGQVITNPLWGEFEEPSIGNLYTLSSGFVHGDYNNPYQGGVANANPVGNGGGYDGTIANPNAVGNGGGYDGTIANANEVGNNGGYDGTITKANAVGNGGGYDGTISNANALGTGGGYDGSIGNANVQEYGGGYGGNIANANSLERENTDVLDSYGGDNVNFVPNFGTIGPLYENGYEYENPGSIANSVPQDIGFGGVYEGNIANANNIAMTPANGNIYGGVDTYSNTFGSSFDTGYKGGSNANANSVDYGSDGYLSINEDYDYEYDVGKPESHNNIVGGAGYDNTYGGIGPNANVPGSVHGGSISNANSIGQGGDISNANAIGSGVSGGNIGNENAVGYGHGYGGNVGSTNTLNVGWGYPDDHQGGTNAVGYGGGYGESSANANAVGNGGASDGSIANANAGGYGGSYGGNVANANAYDGGNNEQRNVYGTAYGENISNSAAAPGNGLGGTYGGSIANPNAVGGGVANSNAIGGDGYNEASNPTLANSNAHVGTGANANAVGGNIGNANSIGASTNVQLGSGHRRQKRSVLPSLSDDDFNRRLKESLWRSESFKEKETEGHRGNTKKSLENFVSFPKKSFQRIVEDNRINHKEIPERNRDSLVRFEGSHEVPRAGGHETTLVKHQKEKKGKAVRTLESKKRTRWTSTEFSALKRGKARNTAPASKRFARAA